MHILHNIIIKPIEMFILSHVLNINISKELDHLCSCVSLWHVLEVNGLKRQYTIVGCELIIWRDHSEILDISLSIAQMGLHDSET